MQNCSGIILKSNFSIHEWSLLWLESVQKNKQKHQFGLVCRCSLMVRALIWLLMGQFYAALTLLGYNAEKVSDKQKSLNPIFSKKSR